MGDLKTYVEWEENMSATFNFRKNHYRFSTCNFGIAAEWVLAHRFREIVYKDTVYFTLDAWKVAKRSFPYHTFSVDTFITSDKCIARNMDDSNSALNLLYIFVLTIVLSLEMKSLKCIMELLHSVGLATLPLYDLVHFCYIFYPTVSFFCE